MLGAGLRVRQFLAHRALWLDELYVSLNIVHRSYAGLLRPLDWNQGAPVGWLWGEKTAVEIFGNHDTTLRILPLLLSFGSLVFFYCFVRRWLSGFASVLACALFAFAPTLINYATQVKQYGADVFFVLVVIVMTTWVLDQPSFPRTVLWTISSVIAMWCSHAAVLALGSCTVVLLVILLIKYRSWKTFRLVLVAPIAFVVSLAIEYSVNLHAIAGNRALVDYWKRGSPPSQSSLSGDATWLRDALVFFMRNPLEFARPTLALALVGVGMVLFVARRGAVALVVVSPVVVTLVAALLHRYPLHERLSLYLAPIVFLALASLLDLNLPKRFAPLTIVALLAVVAVGAAPVKSAVAIARTPLDVEDSRGPFAFAAARWEQGDALLIEQVWAEPAYAYYGPQYGLRVAGTFRIPPAPKTCPADARIETLRRYRRVWIVVTHRASTEPSNRNAIYESYFAALGPPEATFHGAGSAAAYLFTVGASASAANGIRAATEDRCVVLTLYPTVTRQRRAG